MTVIDNQELRAKYRLLAGRDVQRDIARDDPRFECNMRFAGHRIEEGIELAGHFQREYGRRLRVLDVGGGNGGVAFGLANDSSFEVTTVDVFLHPSIREFRAITNIPVRQVVAAADHLPFRNAVADIVLCLETLEHLPRVPEASREMMRVLRTSGQVMITTPARVRFLFTPDPHFAIRGLLLLPDRLQKRAVERWLHRAGEYDVQHTFWSARSIIRGFPGRTKSHTLVAIPPPGRPRNFREILWKLLRHVLWDRIVIYK